MQSYCSARNIEALKKTDVTSMYDRAVDTAFEFFQEDLELNNIILAPVFYNKYREILVQEGLDPEQAQLCRTTFIRNKFCDKYKNKVTFHSQTGNLPGIMCANTMSVGQLYRQIQLYESAKDDANVTADLFQTRTCPDLHTLRNTAHVLVSEVNNLVPSNEYPFQTEVSLESSDAFVPSKLIFFCNCWLIHKP